MKNEGRRIKVLMLSPEPPYPLHGGGAFRTASLLHYFARFAEVDLILISETGLPALLPAGLVHSQQVIPLPRHSRSLVARVLRNARRAVRGVPPLVDRMAGLDQPFKHALGDKRYDLGIIEHLWCAPYVEQLRSSCAATVLDLHNIESVLHARCAGVNAGLVGAGHRRFAAASRKLESALLTRYSSVLVASEEDARVAREIAPGARITVYPNALPWVETPCAEESQRIVFSGNFEYHPNIDAVRFLVREIWPEVRRRHPDLRLRLVGRGDRFIRHLLAGAEGIEVTGPVPDALAEIAQAQIVVAPLRAGSGTRVKILEAWAAARAVIATPLAAEGLDIHDGLNVALASDAKAFVAGIDRVLGDSVLKSTLGAGGRRTFESQYSWPGVWAKLDFNQQLMNSHEGNGYTWKF
jgi:glycosyltransferase involved in cell wall biosynthesis